MTIKWTKWNREEIKKIHGQVYFYRDLYEGDHSNLFERAKSLIDKGEIIDSIIQGNQRAQNVRTPYLIANISKLIPEIPAMLVARSIGSVTSSINSTPEQNKEANKETDEIIEGTDDETTNGVILNLQKELVEQIEKNSKLKLEHWTNIVQQQVDGGLVGVPWNDELGLRIEFKQRDVYFPHEDDLGADLAFERTFDDKKYLHVYRERVDSGDLKVKHFLYEIKENDDLLIVEEEESAELLGIDETETLYEGRSRPFIVYWPNEKTFAKPLGKSCLSNQEALQDEINWTLTRNAITFERNGKPRIAVSKEIFAALQDRAEERYGDSSKIDHRDLEITTYDDNGKAMEVIQIDITKIGDIQWVRDLMKMMFMLTKTSEKAVDFYLDGTGSSNAQSGVAKFYDLFISIVKAEQIQGEYIYFLKQLFENCLWLANKDDDSVIIEEPDVSLRSMIPISRKEMIEENVIAHGGEVQSLETTVRRNNPSASEEWINEELERLEEERAERANNNSLPFSGGNLSNFTDNRDPSGNPIEDEVDE
ncbi:hypothetical protein [Bacillus suaedae]|uniref:Uncharacterized protein n=1 Tax=Halalkalibacter suaedae TaxID=2822140 RepID=A0A940WPU7_9BACI|nr:hypothetical protein [Bacillus suaedae]MBP3950330.1 hypothetical protein [Bacillus suaedae]